MRILQFPTVTTNKHHLASLASLRLALEDWHHRSFKDEHGYSIEGNEIYWLERTGPADGIVNVGINPGLSVGLRQGNNEGWIVTISACLKLKPFKSQSGSVSAYLPIYLVKVWTPEAAGLLSSAILRGSWDAFQPEALEEK